MNQDGDEPPSDQHRYDNACRLVGKFMQHWSGLESEINRGIRKVFRLSYVEGAIVAENMAVAGKINTLRTAYDYASQDLMGDDWRQRADKMFRDILELPKYRNRVAHDYFEPWDEGQIAFNRVIASRTFRETIDIWSEETVGKLCAEMDRLTYDLSAFLKDLLEALEKLGRTARPTSPPDLPAL